MSYLTSSPARWVLALLAASQVAGCYSEDLNIADLYGHVTIPKDKVSQTLIDPVSGASREVVDIGMIGPVYVGLYPAVDNTLANYPLPEIGPSGEANPYGGTTIGDLRYACFEFFQCKLVSNRFASYDDILTFFRDVIGEIPRDSFGQEIKSGEYFRQTCFDLLEVNADWEVRLLAEDRNEDGVIDDQDLDFVDDGNGNFVADFRIPQADFYEGMSAWAFMDAPKFFATEDDFGNSFQKMDGYRTCNPNNGYFENTYDLQFRAGLVYQNVLNLPDDFLKEGGDVVASEPYIWTNPTVEAEIVLDMKVDLNAAGGQ